MNVARRTPNPIAALVALLVFTIFAGIYISHEWIAWTRVSLTPAIAVIAIVKITIELIAAWYGVAFATNAATFVFIRASREHRTLSAVGAPPIGILYLCCDDADRRALHSLSRLDYPGAVHVVIHDDSKTPEGQRLAEEIASELADATQFCVHVLRRPARTGGKPAAVNYALAHTAHLFELFLLCDNDSTVLDPLTLQRSIQHLTDPAVAVVQLRPRPVDLPGTCSINRLLGRSIAAFHAFLLPSARFGWMPFIGHNAVLRTSAVMEVGGLTPGCFADDLDLTVRLNRAGYRVVYAPDIEMGETHPSSYEAFRRRSYKWAYGCMQTLKAHAWTVIRSPQFSFAEKLSFLHFAGFYALQAVLLVYLLLVFAVAPLVLSPPASPINIGASILAGTAMIVVVFLPILAYAFKEGEDRKWGVAIVMCGLVYGGADFAVARGVWDGLRGRQRPWTPTNAPSGETEQGLVIAEACFGLVLLLVAAIQSPALLYFPSSYLFAGKFMFGPALSLLYHDVKPDISLEPLVPSADAAVGIGSA